jgi:hypothetical protein
MRSRRSLSIQASLALVFVSGALPILVGACEKKEERPMAIDAGPPPVPTDAAPTQLVPMDEDTGAPVPDAAPAHHTGGGSALSVNQERAKQCCAALKKQAGTDPLLAGIVAQCTTVAMQMGPSAGGQAPEFAPLRNFLKGKNMPAICQGL